jgi:hypothetical protein
LQEELERKSVVLATTAAKMTGRTLARLMAAALREMKRAKNAPVRGKQSMKELADQNAGLTSIPITDGNIKSFDRVARKYSVDYALKRDGGSPPKWLVFFKARDADALTAAFAEFTQNTLRRENKPSVLKALLSVPEKAFNAVRERQKVRERGRGGPEL